MYRGAQIKRSAVIAITFCAVIIADQITKALVLSYLDPYSALEIIPGFFSLVNVRNPGAAFGILNDGGELRTLFLIGVSIVAFVIIAFLLRHSRNKVESLALSLIGSGAIGNLIDRLRFGEVVDFLDFSIGSYHWPAFNVADSAITLGVIVYLYFSIFPQKKVG